MTLDELDQAIEGKVRYVRQGQPAPYKLNADERLAFDQAKRDGYFTNRRRPNLQAAYWRYCSIADLPYVRIEPERRFARVTIDMWSSSFNLLPAGIERARDVIRRLSVLPCNVYLGDIQCGSDRVPLVDAEEMTRQLWLIGTSPDLRAEAVTGERESS